ncbi:LuxR family transcriptional regulator [Kribbella antibiotica]|uniref:LuxR family transcriptional regulator n=1 Tax=Kribbella antibiotica TaxID=190195 RepID=A0A4R4ZQJ6_9ACTN|nr:LuxR family transcriptional regulator [Kribbella antibiotica]
MREQVLTAVRPVVPFDGYVWVLTDPVTCVGTAPLAAVPGLAWPELPGLVRWRYLEHGTRWTDLRAAGTAVNSFRGRSAHILTVACWDRFGCWAWLDLWRSTPFTRAEQNQLGALAAVLTTGLRRAQARTFTAAPQETPGGPAIVVLDADLRVRIRTPAAVEALEQLNPSEEVIPAAAYNLAAALIAAEQGMPVGPAWSRVHLGSGRWITLRAARASGESDIVVSIEDSTPAERLEVFGLAHGLSPREREVLTELATGIDSRGLAERLVLSRHTVDDHVKAVLAKTGSATRGALLARIAGTG